MLNLTEKQAEEIIEHSLRESPIEACGILAGKEGRIEKIYQIINAEKSAQTFYMDPQEQLEAMREIEDLRLEMIGIYHSHLKTDAYPSARDVELAYYPGVSCVIVSIKNKDKPNIRSFKIGGGRITEGLVKVE